MADTEEGGLMLSVENELVDFEHKNSQAANCVFNSESFDLVAPFDLHNYVNVCEHHGASLQKADHAHNEQRSDQTSEFVLHRCIESWLFPKFAEQKSSSFEWKNSTHTKDSSCRFVIFCFPVVEGQVVLDLIEIHAENGIDEVVSKQASHLNRCHIKVTKLEIQNDQAQVTNLLNGCDTKQNLGQNCFSSVFSPVWGSKDVDGPSNAGEKEDEGGVDTG